MARSLETIDDLLADPLIQAVMRADRVETGALKQMLSGVAAKRRERGPRPQPAPASGFAASPARRRLRSSGLGRKNA